MNRPATLLTASIVFTTGTCFLQATTIRDDFAGAAINSAFWETITPFPDSAVQVGGGYATLLNHGELLTIGSFATPYEVTGRFRLSGSYHDSFNIAIRTSGGHLDPRFYDNGFMMTVATQTDDGWRHNLVRITKNNEIVVDAMSAISLNTFYDFKIVDNGLRMDFYFGDMLTPLVSVNDTTSYGARIGIYNREGGGGGSWISNGSKVDLDYLAITQVPDSAGWLGQFSMALLGIGSLFVHSPRNHQRTQRMIHSGVSGQSKGTT